MTCVSIPPHEHPWDDHVNYVGLTGKTAQDNSHTRLSISSVNDCCLYPSSQTSVE